MSFVGDLEHLPIVDVIQLLHSTRKSGTLCLRSAKGESQLVFNQGFIVSANHLNNSVRIGQILLEMQTISQEQLDAALHEQELAGANRRPLIASLIESGKIRKEDAFRGLETLIEMTIVEVLTWTTGTFTLDVDSIVVSDEYRYFPENLHEDLHLNTQSVLMDALRIYDEKKRDGSLVDEPAGPAAGSPAAGPAIAATLSQVDDGPDISAMDLGLDDLEVLDRRVPDVFCGIKDMGPPDGHRQKVKAAMRQVSETEQFKVLSYLQEISGDGRREAVNATAPPLAAIVYSQSELVSELLTLVCKHKGILVFTTDEAENLDPIIDQSLTKGFVPLLVVAPPERVSGPFSPDRLLAMLHQKRTGYPQLDVLQLAPCGAYEFFLRALQDGVRAVLPFPVLEERPVTFGDDVILFLKSFRCYLDAAFSGPGQQAVRLFKESFTALGSLRDPPALSLALLRFTAALFERTVTLVVGRNELIAERAIGIGADRDSGPTPPLRFTIPLDRSSLLKEVLDKGQLFFGPCNDQLLNSHLFAKIGRPSSPSILVAPLKSMDRVIALTYADFGDKAGTPVPVELFDTLTRHAGLVLDAALLRKKFERPPQTQNATAR
jgi:hypothetical protein